MALLDFLLWLGFGLLDFDFHLDHVRCWPTGKMSNRICSRCTKVIAENSGVRVWNGRLQSPNSSYLI